VPDTRASDSADIDWGTLAGLALGPVVALGFARFAYSLLLPGMRADLGWSFAEAGTINTANAVGYLVGAIAATAVSRHFGPRAAFGAGLLVTSVAVLASAATGAFALLLVLRFVAGVAGAVVFVVGAALASGLVVGERGGAVIGVYLAGAAAGVVVSGAVVPALLDGSGHDGWRLGWLALGGLSVAATGVALGAAARAPVPAGPPRAAPGWRAAPIAPAMLAYGLFGAGYIAYATFIVAYLREGGAGTVEVALFWMLLGLTSLACVFAWGGVLRRLRGGRGLALTAGVTAAGAALPLLSDATAVSFASAALFGCAFLAVPTAATAFGRSAHPPHHWTVAIAALTVAFALGQCAGPVVAGLLSDGAAGIRSGLILSVAVLAAGSLVALAQPHRVAD
jgi:predicted MFS family arabinose efflux permease